ncbi:hypothetical protein MKW98_028355 [Papaver atlanticum]|uniref:Uncharacterized protein n=1 Tax=Papaver atlanticum TaxID=357466 RepID=A0AAD4SY55_9MAGN|nr:hypothetical protein MKW98_028355 [Papaver atlanticum]
MKGTSIETSSVFTKKLQTGVLGELDNFLKSTQDDQAKKIINVADANNETMGQTSIQLPMSAFSQEPVTLDDKGTYKLVENQRFCVFCRLDVASLTNLI